MSTRFSLIPTGEAERPAVQGVTIDAPHSLDLDDAIWLEEADGRPRITVSIADVAADITPDRSLDARALERGFTRYFSQGNAPMLPRRFSEDSLSLLPGQQRGVVCIRIALDEDLDPLEVTAFHANLTTDTRLNHGDIQAIVDGKPEQEERAALRPMLASLAVLSGRLLEKRRKRGELALYDLNAGWALSEEGALRRLEREERHLGYIVVQEMMILANRVTAELLIQADAPALFRNHTARAAAPDRDSLLADIRNAIAQPGLFDMETLQQRLSLILSRARYGPDLYGHFGLNLPAYVHFTSPIRRYADLINHRVLTALLKQAPLPYTRAELVEIGDHLNHLADEEIDARARSFKRKAEERAAELADVEPERIARLPESEVYRILEVSAGKGLQPEPLRKALHTRIASATISLKETYFLLFRSECAGEGWASLRHAALEWVTRHPFHAVSLLSLGGQSKAWTVPQYRYTGSGRSYWCTASVTRDDAPLDSGALSSPVKKSAQQRAALALCYRLLGVPPPLALMEAQPPPTEKPKPAPKVTPAQKRRASAPQRAQEMAAKGDWVSAVWYLAGVLTIKQPRILNRIDEQEAEEKRFHCKLTFGWDGQTLELESAGATRQQAKQQAARAIWQHIQGKREDERG